VPVALLGHEEDARLLRCRRATAHACGGRADELQGRAGTEPIGAGQKRLRPRGALEGAEGRQGSGRDAQAACERTPYAGAVAEDASRQRRSQTACQTHEPAKGMGSQESTECADDIAEEAALPQQGSTQLPGSPPVSKHLNEPARTRWDAAAGGHSREASKH